MHPHPSSRGLVSRSNQVVKLEGSRAADDSAAATAMPARTRVCMHATSGLLITLQDSRKTHKGVCRGCVNLCVKNLTAAGAAATRKRWFKSVARTHTHGHAASALKRQQAVALATAAEHDTCCSFDRHYASSATKHTTRPVPAWQPRSHHSCTSRLLQATL